MGTSILSFFTTDLYTTQLLYLYRLLQEYHESTNIIIPIPEQWHSDNYHHHHEQQQQHDSTQNMYHYIDGWDE